MLPTPFRFGQSGFEPPTPWSRTKCASPCATTRFGKTLFNIWFLTIRVNKTQRLHVAFIDIDALYKIF